MELRHDNYSIDSPTSGAANGDAEDQPIDDGSKGELVVGPGAGGMQPRPSEVKKALPPLTYQQEEMLKKAKRYAMEQSVQQVGYLIKSYWLLTAALMALCLSKTILGKLLTTQNVCHVSQLLFAIIS